MHRRIFVAALVALPGCLVPKGDDPLPQLRWPAAKGSRASVLAVLVHGRGGKPEDFELGGFNEVSRAAGLDVDFVGIKAHAGYYKDRTLGDHVVEEIVRPARAQGYARVVLIGVSRGGLGVLATARKYPEDVDAVIAFAPFLGPKLITDEIREAGGLDAWTPAGPVEDIEKVWVWLREQAHAQAPRPPIWILWGEDDGFAPNMQLLEEVWPPDRITRGPGGHDWATWSRLWEGHLRRDPLKLRG